MLKKTSITLLLGIFLSSCVKRDNDLDCYSENFENNSFLIESATITNPNNNTPNPYDPSGLYPLCGSVDLKLKINKINSGLEYNIGICWDTSINPTIGSYYVETGGTTPIGMEYIDNKDVCFQINSKFIGGGLVPFSNYQNSYLHTNTTYYFRYFIYISGYKNQNNSFTKSWHSDPCNPITKYSDNFKIIIP